LFLILGEDQMRGEWHVNNDGEYKKCTATIQCEFEGNGGHAKTKKEAIELAEKFNRQKYAQNNEEWVKFNKKADEALSVISQLDGGPRYIDEYDDDEQIGYTTLDANGKPITSLYDAEGFSKVSQAEASQWATDNDYAFEAVSAKNFSTCGWEKKLSSPKTALYMDMRGIKAEDREVLRKALYSETLPDGTPIPSDTAFFCNDPKFTIEMQEHFMNNPSETANQIDIVSTTEFSDATFDENALDVLKKLGELGVFEFPIDEQ